MTNKTWNDFYQFDRLAILLALAILLCLFTVQRQKQKLVIKGKPVHTGAQDVKLRAPAE